MLTKPTPLTRLTGVALTEAFLSVGEQILLRGLILSFSPSGKHIHTGYMVGDSKEQEESFFCTDLNYAVEGFYLRKQNLKWRTSLFS